MTTRSKPSEEIRWLDRAETFEMFDRVVRDRLHISGKEFIRRWDAGEYQDLEDDDRHPDLAYLGGLIPFARTNGARS